LDQAYWIVRPAAAPPRRALAAVLDWLRWQAATPA
jgi:hypothetical protein